ncbi:MAG: hypothetical protein H6581_31175 [Bacteroidia bacterium]|nr:hypothetical protein [Bacteroidia bacterium]
MTKFYGGTLLITEETLSRLANPGEFNLRMMDKVRAKGKDHPVVIYEVIDGDLPAERQLKLQTHDSFERGVEFYLSSQFEAAKVAFREVLKVFPDPAASLYITRCNRFLTYGLPEAWDGVTEMPHK